MSDGSFELISKAGRIYRHIGRSRPGELGFSMSGADGMRVPARPGQSPAPSRQAALAELCRRLVLEAYAPAAVLINSKHECLFSLGPTDRYLRVAPGSPTTTCWPWRVRACATSSGRQSSGPFRRTRASSSRAVG